MPSKQPDTIDVVGYLTVEPTFERSNVTWGKDSEGRPILTGGKITGVTVNRPERLTRGGTFVTKVTLRVKAEVFLPLIPQAVLHIGAGEAEVIEVEVHDPAYPPDDTPQGD